MPTYTGSMGGNMLYHRLRGRLFPGHTAHAAGDRTHQPNFQTHNSHPAPAVETKHIALVMFDGKLVYINTV